MLPGGLWEASWSHLGLMLDPPKTNFGAYFEDVRIIFYIALNLRRKASGSDGSGAEDLRKAPPSNVYTCLNFPM